MTDHKPYFEGNMQRLEQIVRMLERGDAPLDESMELFREGTELVRSCSQLLDQAQMQVRMIMVGPDGIAKEEVFNDECSE